MDTHFSYHGRVFRWPKIVKSIYYEKKCNISSKTSDGLNEEILKENDE